MPWSPEQIEKMASEGICIQCRAKHDTGKRKCPRCTHLSYIGNRIIDVIGKIQRYQEELKWLREERERTLVIRGQEKVKNPFTKWERRK